MFPVVAADELVEVGRRRDGHRPGVVEDNAEVSLGYVQVGVVGAPTNGVGELRGGGLQLAAPGEAPDLAGVVERAGGSRTLGLQLEELLPGAVH